MTQIHQGKRCQFKPSRAGIKHPQSKAYTGIITDIGTLSTTSLKSLPGTIRIALVVDGPLHEPTVTPTYLATNAPKYWFTGTILFRSQSIAFGRRFLGLKKIQCMLDRGVLNQSANFSLPS